MPDTNTTDPNLAATVHHSGGSYPVVAGWDILDGLGERLVDVGVRGAAYVITDDNVMNPYGRRVQRALEAAGIAAHCFIIPAGESSKSFELAQAIYGWLAERRAERGHAIVSVGGGVPGDLGGFIAATYLRGMPFVQVPTSMAAMVDASIGGRVAINPARRQEPGRGLLPAEGGVRRSLHAVPLGKARTRRGLGRGHQARLHPRRRAGGRVRGNTPRP